MVATTAKADLLEPFLDGFLAAAVVLRKEFVQHFGRGLLEGLQSRPSQEQRSHHGTAGILKPLRDLRKHLLEPGQQTLQFRGVLIHQLPSFLGEKLQLPGLHRVRIEAAELLGMSSQQLQNEIAVPRIALGAGRVKSFAVVGHGVGMDGK